MEGSVDFDGLGIDNDNQTEFDPFHVNIPEGNRAAFSGSVVMVAQFAHDCWVAGVDPDEMGSWFQQVGVE